MDNIIILNNLDNGTIQISEKDKEELEELLYNSSNFNIQTMASLIAQKLDDLGVEGVVVDKPPYMAGPLYHELNQRGITYMSPLNDEYVIKAPRYEIINYEGIAEDKNIANKNGVLRLSQTGGEGTVYIPKINSSEDIRKTVDYLVKKSQGYTGAIIDAPSSLLPELEIMLRLNHITPYYELESGELIEGGKIIKDIMEISDDIKSGKDITKYMDNNIVYEKIVDNITASLYTNIKDIKSADLEIWKQGQEIDNIVDKIPIEFFDDISKQYVDVYKGNFADLSSAFIKSYSQIVPTYPSNMRVSAISTAIVFGENSEEFSNLYDILPPKIKREYDTGKLNHDIKKAREEMIQSIGKENYDLITRD